MRARAPASAANLGPGFDTLAIALDRYVEVEVEPAVRLIVRSEGEGAGLSDDPSHLAARVAIDVAGTDRLSITVRSQIPMARGLGSSAALAVAAAAAAGAERSAGGGRPAWTVIPTTPRPRWSVAWWPRPGSKEGSRRCACPST